MNSVYSIDEVIRYTGGSDEDLWFFVTTGIRWADAVAVYGREATTTEDLWGFSHWVDRSNPDTTYLATQPGLPYLRGDRNTRATGMESWLSVVYHNPRLLPSGVPVTATPTVFGPWLYVNYSPSGLILDWEVVAFHPLSSQRGATHPEAHGVIKVNLPDCVGGGVGYFHREADRDRLVEHTLGLETWWELPTFNDHWGVVQPLALRVIAFDYESQALVAASLTDVVAVEVPAEGDDVPARASLWTRQSLDKIDLVQLAVHLSVSSQVAPSAPEAIRRLPWYAPADQVMEDFSGDAIPRRFAHPFAGDSGFSGQYFMLDPDDEGNPSTDPVDEGIVLVGNLYYHTEEDSDEVVECAHSGNWIYREDSVALDGGGFVLARWARHCSGCDQTYCASDDSDHEECHSYDDDDDDDYEERICSYRSGPTPEVIHNYVGGCCWPFTIGFEVEKNSIFGADDSGDRHSCDCGPDLFWSHWTTDGSCGVEGITNAFGLFTGPERPWFEASPVNGQLHHTFACLTDPALVEETQRLREAIVDLIHGESRALREPADIRCGGHLSVRGPSHVWGLPNIRRYAGLYYALYRGRLHNSTGSAYVNKNKPLREGSSEKYVPIRMRSSGFYEFRLFSRVISAEQLVNRYYLMALWANAVWQGLSFNGYLRVNRDLLRTVYPDRAKRNHIRDLARHFQNFLDTGRVHDSIKDYI